MQITITKMKRIIVYFSVVLAYSLLAISCKEDEPVIADLSVNVEDIAMGADGGLALVEVSGDVSWYTSVEEPWLTVTPATGFGPAICEIKVDSSVIAEYRNTDIFFYSSTGTSKRVHVVQAGYEKGLYIENAEDTLFVENSAEIDKRVLEIKLTTNVQFDVTIESESKWLTYKKTDIELDYGDRPRTIVSRFDWIVNTESTPRFAKIIFTPDEGEPVKINVQQKAAPKITDDRAGDSLAVLAIYNAMNGIFKWDASENMMYWDGVELWEATDEEVKDNPKLLGRLKSVAFRLFETKETIPYQVKYLKTARSITFTGNSNTFIKSIALGNEITELAQYGNLKELTISAYGLVSLPDNFMLLGKSLEKLDLSSNNFEYDGLECLTKENFSKLKVLRLNKISRYDTTNNLNEITKDSIGFRWFTGYGDGFTPSDKVNKTFFKRLMQWDTLEELSLALNLLDGELPSNEELKADPEWTEFYEEKDFDKNFATTDEEKLFIDTIVTAKDSLIGTPKVWPKMKVLSINLCFLTGDLPNWILYHPYLAFWNPFSMIFTQETDAINSLGQKAGFNSEPVSLSNYSAVNKEKSYYELYPWRNPNYEE